LRTSTGCGHRSVTEMTDSPRLSTVFRFYAVRLIRRNRLHCSFWLSAILRLIDSDKDRGATFTNPWSTSCWPSSLTDSSASRHCLPNSSFSSSESSWGFFITYPHASAAALPYCRCSALTIVLRVEWRASLERGWIVRTAHLVAEINFQLK